MNSNLIDYNPLEYFDAFIVLTRQGVVLMSDDTKVTQEEDYYLHNLNHRLIKRKEQIKKREEQED